MKYLSTAEASGRWGISTQRITILAKEGRIPGATQIGMRWLIPEDATKPIDGRTKAVKPSLSNEPYFRYPTFEGREIRSISPPLSQEEIQLKEAMESFHACRFEEAVRLLGDLPERTEDRYLRINALRLAGICSVLTCDSERFLDCYGKLTNELQQDFPRKCEMQSLIHELDALLGDSSYFAEEFRIETGYKYHESYLPHLAALCTISLFFSNRKGLSREFMKSYEVNCAIFDTTENYLDSQTMHLYLGCVYAMQGEEADAKIHLHRALETAEKYGLYYGIATEFYYMENAFSPALHDFSEKFVSRLRACSDDIHRRYKKFMEVTRRNSIFTLLRHKEYIFVLYAGQGLTNKEVAEKLQLSERTVSKRYGEIYNMFSIKNKQELVDLIINTQKS